MLAVQVCVERMNYVMIIGFTTHVNVNLHSSVNNAIKVELKDLFSIENIPCFFLSHSCTDCIIQSIEFRRCVLVEIHIEYLIFLQYIATEWNTIRVDFFSELHTNSPRSIEQSENSRIVGERSFSIDCH